MPLIVLNAAVAAYGALYLAWPRPLVLSASINVVILCVPCVAWLRLVGRGAVNRAAAAIYVLLFLGATRFVEPIDDQDSEIQGTAFGIARHGTPMMRYDRRLPYHFAHPYLFHWLSAEVILLAGDIGSHPRGGRSPARTAN